MAPDPRSYPFRARCDARTAIAKTLADFLESLSFTLPKVTAPFRFAKVHDRWSSWESSAMSAGGLIPAAAVLPDRLIYEDSSFTPREIEETWSGGDPSDLDDFGKKLFPIGDGSGDGFVLFEVCQVMLPIIVLYRGKSRPQAEAIAKKLEEVFIEDAGIVPDYTSISEVIPVPPDALQPIRYGLRLTAKRYFNRKVRYTQVAQQLMDSEANARENRWIGQFEMEAHMQLCVVRRGRAMKPRIELVVDGEPAP